MNSSTDLITAEYVNTGADDPNTVLRKERKN